MRKLNFRKSFTRQPLEDILEYALDRATTGNNLCVPSIDDAVYIAKSIPYEDIPLYMSVKLYFCGEARQDIAFLQGKKIVLDTDKELSKEFLRVLQERLNSA
jgi:hypothetical protein